MALLEFENNLNVIMPNNGGINRNFQISFALLELALVHYSLCQFSLK